LRTAQLTAPAVLLCAWLTAAAQTQFQFDQTYDSLSGVRGVQDVQISPDGSRVAWVEDGSEIVLARTDGAQGAERRISRSHGPTWSPDGKGLAYFSDADSGERRLWVSDGSGGSAKQLASFKGSVADARWSPTGDRIALLYIENSPRARGPMQPATPESGVVGEHIYNQRIAVVDAGTGAVRQVSQPDLYVHEFDWSPDGKAFAATAAPGPGDNNWYIAKLYVVDAATGAAKAILKPPLQIAEPRWSPDGASIAYIGGLMSDEGSTGGDIYLAPAAGGAPRNVTPGMKASASGIHWTDAGRILFAEHIDGDSGFATLDTATGRIETVWRGPGTISGNGWLPGVSIARNGRVSAVSRHSFTEPPEVWAGPIGGWRRISQINSKAVKGWGEARSIHWTCEGRPVQGWLLFPQGYDPNRRWPLVVWVHGGPAVMEKSGWPSDSLPGVLAAAGYFVLFPNPRGSFGFGEAFTEANVRDFGYGDFRDILAGVDEVVRTLPVDNDRVGITGWSYGGFMSMWAVTQTTRFRAAVAGAGLANWLSYYGENQIDQWLIPYFGASAYDDPAAYERSSPITFIKNVKTPTLVLVGDRDAECPAPQSWEFWHALKTLGVETQFVIYPDEGHSINNPEHQRDIVRRAIGWFDRLMGQKPGA